MKLFLRSPFFWLIFAIFAVITGTVAIYYFPESNSIIHINLTMNRGQAIDKTVTIARQFQLGPNDAWHAATFATDEKVKTFVELEGGGKDAFIAMMDQELYQPYTWEVRLFKPFEQHELLMYFTPSGTPYGFQEILSEDTSRHNISTAQAQEQAIHFAQAFPWNIALTHYALVETSQETKPSGRIDHLFTYERTNATIGEGFYRLKIVVSGDRVSSLLHSVKVPDAFLRRYQQIRSANENIAYIANMIMIAVYIIGCCFIGLFFLIRRRWVIWRAPIYWAIFIATLASFTIANHLPLSWMEYNTALSPAGFLMQQGIKIIFSLLFLTITFSFVFVAAESLSRRAFGHHLQLWQLYSPSVAPTYTVLGYTITGYLLMPIMLCYTVLFYIITMKFFGWWNPASVLFNPNILATYVPWLEPIAISLQAGFFEECLFRAVPLASAALLGTRFGKRHWWIAGTFIIQAVVFGAAHANYPAQPAYARLVELFTDSALFGAIYLWLGLLPVIITHSLYDIFWFSLPIFVSNAPGAFLNKAIIIVCAMIPLIIILVRRYSVSDWQTIQPNMFNRAWQPSHEEPKQFIKLPPAQAITLSKTVTYGIYMLTIGALLAWVFYGQFKDDAPPFTISRDTAYEKSIRIAQDKNIDISKWYPITYPFIHYNQKNDIKKQHRFVWQYGGKEIYHQLLQSYLPPAHWITRFVTFEGPIIERTEEHLVHLNPDGSFLRYLHKLPESAPSTSLSQQDAQNIALKSIAQQFSIPSDHLRLISAVTDKQPARTDWTMTYANSTDYPLDKGEARIVVKIAGDQVIDTYRYIHVPEQWQRIEDNRLLFAHIIHLVSWLAIVIITIVGASVAVMQWQPTAIGSIIGIFIVLSMLMSFDLFNSWPTIIADFTTSQPFTDQLFRSVTMTIIMLIVQAASLATVFGFVTFTHTAYYIPSLVTTILRGICIGICVLGLQAILIYAIPSLAPSWTNYAPLQNVMPLVAGVTSTIVRYFALTILLFLCLILLNTLTNYGSRQHWRVIIMSIIIGYICAGMLYADNILLFGSIGALFTILFGLGYYILLRFDYPIIPIITATYTIGENIQYYFFHGYPTAHIEAIISIALIALIASWWSRKIVHNIRKDQGEIQ